MIEPGFADHVDGGHYILPVPVEPTFADLCQSRVPRETEGSGYEEWLASNAWSSGCAGTTKRSDLP